MKIGVITIGQSPRPDVIGEMGMVLGESFEIIEKGALDYYSVEEVQKLVLNIQRGLVTKLRDGTEVMVSHEIVNPEIQKRIFELEKIGVDLILLLCTGRFPDFDSNVLIIRPSEILSNVTKAIISKGRMASISPSIQQISGAPYEREHEGVVTYHDTASPYGSVEEIEKLGERLKDKNLDLILLNCMGFNSTHKNIIKEKTGKPVIQSSSLVGKIILELI